MEHSMENYLVVFSATLVLIFFSFLLYKKTGNVAFPFGIFFMYYWSLVGGISLTRALGNTSPDTPVLTLVGKMFPVSLDADYSLSLGYYALFMIVTVITALMLTFKKADTLPAPPMKFLYFRSFWLATCLFAISFMAVSDAMFDAIANNQSVYVETRLNFGNTALWNLHKITNRISCVLLFFAFAVFFSGKRPLYIEGQLSPALYLPYLVLLASVIIFNLVLGNKSEIVFAAISSGLFYLHNTRKSHTLRNSILALVLLTLLGVINMLRGTGLEDITEEYTLGEVVGEGLFAVLQSNESIAAHISMYGVVSQDVDPTWGSSFVSLAASLVPSSLWPDRPEQIYYHYQRAMDLPENQGFTIHHATGWYLNFGSAGIILGGVVLGLVWASLHNLWVRHTARRTRFFKIAGCCGIWLFTAMLPWIIRAGPEVYKAVFFEALLFSLLFLSLVITFPEQSVKTPARRAL